MDTLEQWLEKKIASSGKNIAIADIKSEFPNYAWDTWEASIPPVVKAILLHRVN